MTNKQTLQMFHQGWLLRTIFPNFVMSNKYLLEFFQNPPVCSGPTRRCQEVSSSAPRGPQLKDWEQMIPSERLGFVFVRGKWLD